MPKHSMTLLVAGLLPLSAVAAPESYALDPYHSYVNFEVDHLGGMSRMRGRFDKSAGKLTIDHAAKTGSLDVVVQAASVSTGDNDKGTRARSRDEHLRSPDFFNVAEFPSMSFHGKTTKWSGDAPAIIDGQLTLLGVTKPLTLTVIHWKCGPDPRTQGKRQMCGGNFTGSLRRSDFGMQFMVPGVGDEVKLWIGIEAFRN